MANPGANAVFLTWNAVVGATSYNIKRGSSASGPFTQLTTGVTATSYWDRGLTAGNRWFYEVSSVSAPGEGLYSTIVNATVGNGTLPSGWTNQDIGSAGLAGNSSCNSNLFIMQGSGSDIWSPADAFYFTSAQVTGDSALIARVSVLQGPDPRGKAGLMFRSDSTPTSIFADLVVTLGNGLSLQWRNSAGQCGSSTVVSGVTAPVWLQLLRSGNVFTGYFSPDGASWTQVGTATVPMASNVLSGLALTAHTNISLATAVFDNVSGGAPVIVQQPAPISATRFAGANFTLTVGASAALPVYYNWSKDGASLPSATKAVLALSNLALSDSGNYAAIVSNAFGVATSSVVSLNVQGTSNAPYAGVVIASRPIGYWRLSETSGKVAYDWAGGNDGTYTNVLGGQPGYNLLDTHRSARFGFLSASNSFAGNIPIDFATAGNATFSVEAWVNGGTQSGDSGIVTKGTGSGGEQFNMDCGGGSHAFRFFVRDSTGSAHLATTSVVPNSKWHHLVGVCDEANGAVILYVDGTNAAQGTITAGSGLYQSANPMTIGARQSGTAAYDFQFTGYIEDVAVYNSALNATQVRTHYQTATNRPPTFLTNPFTVAPATAGAPYFGYIATNAVDPNGDAVTLAKLSGPSWLVVSQNGSLSGTPVSTDAGPNVFQIKVSDPAGLFNSATMNLTVAAPITASVSIQGTNISLDWQGGVAPYQVQTATNLPPDVWMNLGDPISVNTLSLTPSNTAGFYRIQGQ